MLKIITVLSFVICSVALFAQSSTLVGNSISENSVYAATIQINNGSPYVAYSTSPHKKVLLTKYNGSSWEEVGKMPADITAGGELELIFNQDIPYILYDGYNGMNLIKYEGGTWKFVGDKDFASDRTYANRPKITFCNNTPYVVYENKDDSKLALLKLSNNGTWTPLDALDKVKEGAEHPEICADKAGNLIVAWFDRKGSKIEVAQISADHSGFKAFSKKGIPGKDVANFLAINSIHGKLCISYEDSKNGYNLQTMAYDAAQKKWTSLGAAKEVKGDHYRINGNLSVAFTNESKQVAVCLFNGSDWDSPKVITKEKVSELNSCADGETVYVVYVDSENKKKAIVQKLK